MRLALFGIKPWGLAILAVLAVALWFAFRQPKQDREWKDEFARLPGVNVSGHGFTIANVRDFQWDKQGASQEHYFTGSWSLDDLQQIWWVLEPDPKMPAVAHTFLLLQFGNDRLLGLSVEARAQKHQTWGAIPGMFRSYELIYLFASARDLLTLRAVHRDHKIFMFPLKLTRAQRLDYAKSLLSRAQMLDRRPRWYNTAISNCTNELAKAAHLKWRPSFVLTGKADQGLHRAGLIDGADLDILKQQAEVQALVRSLAQKSDAEFDRGLMQQLQKSAK